MYSYDSSEEEYSSNNELSCVESDEEKDMIGGSSSSTLELIDNNDLNMDQIMKYLKYNIYTSFEKYSFVTNPKDFIFYKLCEMKKDAEEDYVKSLAKDHIRQMYYKNNKVFIKYEKNKKDLHDIILKINIFEKNYLNNMNTINYNVNESIFKGDTKNTERTRKEREKQAAQAEQAVLSQQAAQTANFALA
tara:strand:+ start:546 stop:1115 length:570 start_codon:yes stop_codon:yes gene_type:complete